MPDRLVSSTSVTRLYAVLGPVIAVGVVTGGTALAAGLLGFHREEMLIIAAFIGGGVAFPAAYLVFRQAAERKRSQRELIDVQARMGGII